MLYQIIDDTFIFIFVVTHFKIQILSVETGNSGKRITKFKHPDDTMYLLNTNHFKIHQLCDWQWLEGEDGKILKQVPGKPVYTATLVKYAELMCENPSAQGALMGITEA